MLPETHLLFLPSTQLVVQSIVSAVLFGMIFALVAAGLALIWGVADIVNFAHGEYMMIAMYLTLIASNDLGIDPLLMIPINGILLFIAGYLTYILVISKVMDAPMLAQIFTTFAILLILRYSMLYIMGPHSVSVDNFVFSGHTTVYGITLSYPRMATAVVSAIALVAFLLFLKYSRTGKAIRATAQDWDAARVMGIDTDRVLAITWGLGIAAVGVAGTMVATFSPIQPELTPATWTIKAFAAVALGGFGSILGAAAGGVVIAFVEHVGGALLNPSFKELYVFLAFILALIFKPEGLLNRGGAK